MHDVKHDPAGGERIVFRNICSKRVQIFDSLGRPKYGHAGERLGAGRSFLLFHELTHSWTRPWGTPSPRSSEAMAFRMPATCHSLKSRYSLIASAARNDRLRPVLLASFASRFLTAASMRTLTVVEDIVVHMPFVFNCVHYTTMGMNRNMLGGNAFKTIDVTGLAQRASPQSRPGSLMFCGLMRLLEPHPAPPPFSSMNSTPANSKARRTARSLSAVMVVLPSINSARRRAGIGRSAGQQNALKHGRYAREAFEECRQLQVLLRQSRMLI